jgi:hypothetical protein
MSGVSQQWINGHLNNTPEGGSRVQWKFEVWGVGVSGFLVGRKNVDPKALARVRDSKSAHSGAAGR